MSYHEQELSRLKERVLVMAGHAELAVNRAMKALVDRDDNLATQVEVEDTVLDELEVEIDELSLRLLAKAPLAGELRLIAVAMRIARDLERVGDEATTIARRARELNAEPQLKPYADLPRMATIALQMLKAALDAFVDHNAAAARAVVPRDREVDAIHRQLQRELVSFMVEKPNTITRCLNLMTISKALERVADHAANLAEEVVFIYEGQDIRHDPEAKAGIAESFSAESVSTPT